MKIDKLELKNFRNHDKRAFSFGDKTVIVGENGSGKSNILEAIYLLATGKSFRADTDLEMVNYERQFFRVDGKIKDNGDLGVLLNEGRKKFEVNGISKRMMDFAGRLKAVLFGPTDLDLITGSPSIRRRYLDFVIMQTDREYRRSLISYEKGLRQRNKILENIREGLAERNQLWFWDRLLIKEGGYITQKREEYLDKANKSGTRYKAVYDKSVISESRLKQYEVEEVGAAVTLVGPHRDDFTVEMSAKDISKYGSRGEQRMAVMWLKKNESEYLVTDEGVPVWLLDDIFSELDHHHREEVEKEVERQIKKGGQIIMTTADPHVVPKG